MTHCKYCYKYNISINKFCEYCGTKLETLENLKTDIQEINESTESLIQEYQERESKTNIKLIISIVVGFLFLGILLPIGITALSNIQINTEILTLLTTVLPILIVITIIIIFFKRD